MTPRYPPVDAARQGSLAILLPSTPNTSFESVDTVSPSNTGQNRARDGRKFLRRRQRRDKLLVGAVASIVSLVAILALLALCRTSQRRLNSGGAVRRNLSDVEDEENMSSIVEQCLELEEELGLRQAASPPTEEASEAKARLFAMLYESASAFERMRAFDSQGLQGEAHSPPSKVPRISESGESSLGSSTSLGALSPHASGMSIGGAVSALDADAWVGEESGVVFDEGKREQATATQNVVQGLQPDLSSGRARLPASYETDPNARPSVSFSFGTADGSEHSLTSAAWLDGSLASRSPEAVPRRVVTTLWHVPTLEMISAASTSTRPVQRSSRLTGRFSYMSSDQEIELQSVQMETAQQLQQPGGGTDAVLGASSGGRAPCVGGHICQHPFVRLPAVNPDDVHRTFRDEFIHSIGLRTRSPIDVYVKMRTLFAKPSLDAHEVEELMNAAELLANYAAHKLAMPCSRCTASYLLVKLSSLLMAFDYLVCAAELLGEKMNTGKWWPEFVQLFRTDYRLSEIGGTRVGRMRKRLVNRLSAALAIYKQGKRPAPKEIIELKRVGLTQVSKDSHMSHRLWQLWIQDDKDFTYSSSGSESSDSQADDEREAKLP